MQLRQTDTNGHDHTVLNERISMFSFFSRVVIIKTETIIISDTSNENLILTFKGSLKRKNKTK